MHWLLLLFALAQVDAPVDLPKVRRELKPGTIVSTNRDAVRLAREDGKACEAKSLDPQFVRYVFVPPTVDPTSGFQQVAHVANSTFTRVATRPQPRLLRDEAKDTTVVAIDLEKYAGNEKQLAEIVELYERLAPRDSWFNTQVLFVGDRPVEVLDDTFATGQPVEVKLAAGGWGTAIFKTRKGSILTCEYDGRLVDLQPSAVRRVAGPAPPAIKIFAAEPYLEEDGAELFALTRSSVPIMRLDEWVAMTFSSVNGGLYYELAGVEKNLGDTVARFAGADAAKKVLRQTALMRLADAQHHKPGESRSIFQIAGQFDQELAKSKAIINDSGVTRRQRAFLFVSGANIAPAEGVQLVAITFDVAEDNVSPDADPHRNLTTYETYNGGEAILAMPNGMLLYVVFDAQDRTIASVPDTVAWDHEAPKVRTNAGTVRVFSGVSCANCHESVLPAAGRTIGNAGWQPIRNDVARDFLRLSRVLGDRPHGKHADKFREIQRLAANYAADDIALEEMLNRSRLGYQRAVTLASGANHSSHVVAGLADSYWGYWNDPVWPETIVRDLGHVMTRKDAQAYLIRTIEPNPDADLPELYREDRIIARAKDGESITPVQYRTIAPQIAERKLFSKFNLEAQGMNP